MPLPSSPKLRLFLFLFIVVISAHHASASVDPVTAFILKADSLAKAGGDDLLAPYVKQNAVLVGAAVGQLLDVGFEVGQAGEKAAEEENVAFAERVAELHKEASESSVPLELVQIYKGWTGSQRVARAKIKAMEAEGFEVLNAGEYDRAAEIFNNVIELCQDIDDRRTVAVTWGSLGVAHWYRGDWAAVEESYIKALAARRAIEDRILEGKTLNGLGSANVRMGNYDKAIECYDKAAKLRRQTGDLGGLGISLTYKANVYYQMSRFVEAREVLEEAYTSLEKGGSPAQLLEFLNSMANIDSEMGSLSRVDKVYRRAIAIAVEVDQPQDEAICRMNLASNLRLQGRFNEALEQLDIAEPLLERKPDPVKIAQFYRERGLAYRKMGELDRARDALLAYNEQAKQLEDPYYRIDSFIELGYLYQELGAYDQGLLVAEQGQALAKETENLRLQRNAHVLAAVTNHSMGNYEEALRQNQLALEIDRQEEASTNIVEDEIAIASLNAVLGKTDEARESLYNSRPAILEIGRKDLEWALHFGIGHAFENENPDSAVYHYERALNLVEQSHAAVGGAETRSGFLSGERRFFYEEVARYYASLGERDQKQGWQERAFETMERAKARGLLDLLERSALGEMTSAEEALLDSLYRTPGDTPEGKEKQRKIEERYIELRENRLDRSIGKLAPMGAVARLEDVRKLLPKKTVLLEYALGDTTSLLWVADRKGFDFHRVPNRWTLGPKIQRLRDALTQPGTGDAIIRNTARDLYVDLMLPAEERLRKAEKLIIVPDGILFEVPFEILLTENPDENADWSKQPFLVRSYDTAYVPSASVLVKLMQMEKRKYDLELVAMGDPDFSLFGGVKGASAGLAALPHTRSEIENIATFAKDRKKQVFLGSDANEAALKSQLSKETPRILHLATHGLVNPAEPVASSIVLCPDTTTGEDGHVHTLEVLSLPLDVGLVVLSACESARGRVQRGEGVVGLSRAFIASGAGGVVASLWAVSDESTAELMKELYRLMLGKKRPVGEALNAARLELLKHPTYSHPFYWSPFVLIGSAGATPW
ncbi:MAG: CHAT domain-containing protein [Candidatus Latescibacterota bacterium]|nr:MAG: CHAT domain-containing protein [Candidatus Latescibacterota bacterium]